MRVKVTKQDIENGLPHSRTMCPIARACNRSLMPLGFRAEVCGRHIHIVRDTKSAGRKYIERAERGAEVSKLQLPNGAWKFINNFDKELPVSPFEFEAYRAFEL